MIVPLRFLNLIKTERNCATMNQNFENIGNPQSGARFADDSLVEGSSEMEQMEPRRAFVEDDENVSAEVGSVTEKKKDPLTIFGASGKGLFFLIVLFLIVVLGGGYAMIVGHREGYPQESVSCMWGLNLVDCTS